MRCGAPPHPDCTMLLWNTELMNGSRTGWPRRKSIFVILRMVFLHKISVLYIYFHCRSNNSEYSWLFAVYYIYIIIIIIVRFAVSIVLDLITVSFCLWFVISGYKYMMTSIYFALPIVVAILYEKCIPITNSQNDHLLYVVRRQEFKYCQSVLFNLRR